MLTILFLAPFLSPTQRVGPMDDHTAFLNTGQIIGPLGKTVEFPGRPVDMRLLPDGRTLLVKDKNNLRVMNLDDLKLEQTIEIPGGASPTGMALTKDGGALFVTNSENGLIEYTRSEQGSWSILKKIELPGPKGAKDFSFPCGVALAPDERTAYVCLSRNNSLGVVDLEASKVESEIQTGIAPFEIALIGNKAFVTNQGGRRPASGDATSSSAGSEVVVDPRGVAATGTVSVIDRSRRIELREIQVGLQPCAILAGGDRRSVYVANANGDSISVIDSSIDQEAARVAVEPEGKLPFGSMPNGLALSPDGSRLYVALAGSNAVAVLDTSQSASPHVTGFICAGWYPVSVLQAGGRVVVLDNKGTGQRVRFREEVKGMNSHDTVGGLQVIATPSGDVLEKSSQRLRELTNSSAILKAYERSSRTRVAPVPIPKALGEPSPIKHVVYVIKENRSYDQVFGDMSRGDGDPKLCVFGQRITPNQHALAEQFVLLDNYYCNGVLSADGHSWATEGNVTPYLNRAFGGFNRSYTFGNDPITYSSTGFVWDGLLSAGLSFRNYGEMWDSALPDGVDAKKVRSDFREGKTIRFPQSTGIETIKRSSCPDYPGWNLDIPDQYRIDRFLTEFKQDEADSSFPNLVTVYLPQDHTGGPLGPQADVADNDLAVGRLVEAISHSRFWKDTVIFINEDDPQNGFDHIDGHRSICMVVSPYTQSGSVVHNFYNQTSVLHSICQVFGLAPMNQKVAAAPLMAACFKSKPDLQPFTAKPANVDLKEVSRGKAALVARWNREILRLDLRDHEVMGDQAMSRLNRAIWSFCRPGEAYPAAYVGSHGRGLKAKGLRLVPSPDSD